MPIVADTHLIYLILHNFNQMSKLSPKDYEYRRAEGSVSSLNYHFVFVPKRRKAVLIKDVAERLRFTYL